MSGGVLFLPISQYLLLQDILENDDIVLDSVFKNSLMLDLAEVGICIETITFLFIFGLFQDCMNFVITDKTCLFYCFILPLYIRGAIKN